MDLLFDPDRFFERRTESPRIRYPVLVVFLTALLYTAREFIVLSRVSVVPVAEDAFTVVMVLFGLVASVLSATLLWVVNAGSVYLVGKWLGGSGNFRTLFILMGWGYLPMVVFGAFSLAATWTAVQGAAFPQDPQAVQASFEQVTNGTAFRAIPMVAVSAIAWRAFMWTFVVKNELDMTMQNAFFAVLLPTAVTTAWQLYNLL